MSMQKQHRDISNNLSRLDELKVICMTEIGTDKDIKNYNKIYTQTKKLLSSLSMSYNLLAAQRIDFPTEFVEIGLEIEDFKRQMEEFGKVTFLTIKK